VWSAGRPRSMSNYAQRFLTQAVETPFASYTFNAK
jgi:hypothetical protein